MVDSSDLSVDALRSAIADILKSSELSSLTSRIVRNSLEERFNVSLKDRKKEIDGLLMSMIEENQQKQNDGAESPKNGSAEDKEESESEDEIDDQPSVSKKEEKKSSDSKSLTTNKQASKKNISDSGSQDENQDDAQIARKLHESERGLRTRKQPTKRTPKSTTKKEPKAKGEKSRSGFGKLMVLSPDLAEIMGADQLPRSEIVKKMWQIIKERNLTDPKDKRFHICDPQLLKVFGKKRVRTFSMMKYLKQHVKDPALIT